MKSLKFLLQATALGALMMLSACGGGSAADAGTPVVSSPAVVAAVEMTITHKVTITTSLGVIELGLDNAHAPISTANFLQYTNAGFYNGTLFHRVIKDFVIQGGGVVRSGGSLVEKTPSFAAIKLESNVGLRNLRGTLAMARTSAPDSATSQFFINVKDNASLNYVAAPDNNGYAVFGKVLSGMDVMDQISLVSTNSSDAPTVDVTITKVEALK